MYNDYPSEAKCANSSALIGASYQPPTSRAQLEQKRAVLAAEISRVDAALAALDAHPELEAFTETLKAALR